MELGLTGRTVVITGGSSGIGKAVAWEYLKEGCHVAVCSRGQARLEDAVREFQAAGYSVFARSLDVTDYPAVERFADEVAEAYGKIDVWYNNAASNQTKSLMDYSYDEFRNSTEALLVSVFAGCKIAAAHMRKTGGGVILNASSYSAVIPNAGRAPYSACKSAVSSLTRSFAAELAPDQIRVLAYVPGLIATEITRDHIARNRGSGQSAGLFEQRHRRIYERHRGLHLGRKILYAESAVWLGTHGLNSRRRHGDHNAQKRRPPC